MKAKLFTAQPLWSNGFDIIRILTGIMMAKFGMEIFNEITMDNYAGLLENLGFPVPVFMIYLAKIIELVGGLFLMLGLFIRFVTPPLVIVMGVLIWIMADKNFFNGGIFSLFIMLFSLYFIMGAGTWSLDYIIFDKPRNKKQE